MAEEGRKTYLEFIETTVFTDRLTRLTSKETLYALQSDLLQDPTRWPVIQGTHGARKGRVADPEVRRGKSGSFRYLYLFLPHVERIYLIYLFSKDEQDNLTSAQKKGIARMCDLIREEVK
jgi:hypothetical protein